jgi:TonB family protein
LNEPTPTVLFVERRRTAPVDPEAWKKLIGSKPVDARLETLPETKMRRGVFAVSTTVQIALAMALAALPLLYPESLSMRMIYQVTPIAAPVTEVPVAAEPPAEQPKAPKAVPEPIEQPPAPKVIAPRALIAPKPRILNRQEQEAVVPKVESVLTSAKFDMPAAQPERPREPVKTGMLNTGSEAQPTLTAAVEKVQTGGFGDPHGFASPENPTQHGNVARVGSFDLPSGPGYGNGSGGASGARGVVASSGFGNGVAVPPAANGNRTGVKSGGFGAVTVAPEAKAAPKQAESAPAVQPIVILEKSNPVYTDEARRLRIEGEVLVEVIFRASGQVQTVRVVKGLGHGLDEAALRAAEQIRFKPAIQQGQTVDFPAVAHIVFQLAF